MMKPSMLYLSAWILLATSQVLVAEDLDASRQWGQWRGPTATGVTPHGKPPLTWSAEKNIAWKTAIDGKGSSTPIIWGDQVFLLTAINTGKIAPDLPKPEEQPERPFGIKFPNTLYQFVVLCLDRKTGKELWRRVSAEMVPHEGHHHDNNYASASPTTDGQRLWVWFGSAGLFCYDMSGELLWKRDFGAVSMRRSFGEGSSPALHGNRLVINRDNEDQSYIVVLDANTGETIWQKDREEISSWATPLVIEHAGRTQVITSASNKVRSYNLADGSIFWECGGQVGNVTPCPVADQDRVYCMSGYNGSICQAISLLAKGDVTGSDQIAWSLDRGTPYVPSPLLFDGLLYFNQSNDGILTCVDAETGKTLIERTRMPEVGRIYASAVGADNRCYFVSRDGATLVIEKGPQFKVLSTNRLPEGVDASPAIVGNQLFLRGDQHLFCISESNP